jgi:hypothetical protein
MGTNAEINIIVFENFHYLICLPLHAYAQQRRRTPPTSLPPYHPTKHASPPNSTPNQTTQIYALINSRATPTLTPSWTLKSHNTFFDTFATNILTIIHYLIDKR